MAEDLSALVAGQAAALTSCFRLRDGRLVQLRPVAAEDAPRLTRLCEGLSAESSRLRFFRAGRRLTAQEALGLAAIDHVRNAALVVLDGEQAIGLASLNQIGDDPQAEITLLVDDAYQGHGLGRYLLERLILAARRRGYRTLLAELLPDNRRMLELLESASVPAVADAYFGVLRVHLLLAASA
jgi:GNAT superfamily N-acetyltransferase